MNMKFLLFALCFLFLASKVRCDNESTLIEADTAWMIVASSFVMIMTPGLAFFYGGLVRPKHFVSILGQCIFIFCIISCVWSFIGYSLTFGDSKSQFLGGLTHFGLQNIDFKPNEYASTIPSLLFFFYQNKFASITPALFIGATAERVRFSSMIILAPIWTILVYCPIAHWNWNTNGFLHVLGVHDFAGGNCVHISSGTAALICAIFTDYINNKKKNLNEKKKKNIKNNEDNEHNEHKIDTSINMSSKKHGRQIVNQDPEEVSKNQSQQSTAFVFLGTGLLWFGWFGFNAGSALSANSISILALVNTNLGGCTASITWVILEWVIDKKISLVGMCVGAVCGFVGITPGCGFVPLYASSIIGILSAMGTFFFYRGLDKCRYKFDDRLGVFGCHGISGIIGGICVGFFANTETGAFHEGIFYGGDKLLGYQLAGILCSFAWSAFMTAIILIILNACGLYHVIDEENGNEIHDFDEQGVFIPDIEKMVRKYTQINSSWNGTSLKHINESVHLNENEIKIENHNMNIDPLTRVETTEQIISNKKIDDSL